MYEVNIYKTTKTSFEGKILQLILIHFLKVVKKRLLDKYLRNRNAYTL